MPYQKTKEGRLVNEVTLGDGYPLSNDLQPLKVGGEASPMEVSTSLPDDSDNGKVKVNGNFEVTGTTKGVTATDDTKLPLTGGNLSGHLNMDTTQNIYFDGAGGQNVYLNASDSSTLNIGVDGEDKIIVTDSKIEFGQNNFMLVERANAGSDAAGYGQLWVKNDTPNNLYFTNDAGNDVQITNGSSLASASTEFRHIINAGFNYNYTAGTLVYLPLVGYILERNSLVAANEYLTYVAPYDGYLNQVVIRSEEACGSSVVGLHKSSTGTEVPNSTAATTVTVDMAADDTAYKFAFSSSNTFSAGDIIAISFDPTNDANDTVFTVEFILDSSSGL